MSQPTSKPHPARAAWFWTLFLLSLAVGCGKDPEKLFASGQQYFSRGEYQAAAIELKNTLQQRPNHPEARYLLGLCELKLSNFTGAEKELRKASELGYSPDKVIPSLALALTGAGKLNVLVSELGSTHLADRKAMAQLQTSLGDAYVELGKLGLAEDAYAAALDVKPDDPWALTGQAKILAARGNTARALEIVDEILERYPKQPETLTFKASLLYSQGKLKDAVGYLRQAVQVQPGNMMSSFLLAAALLEHGDLDDASRHVESIKKVAPQDVRVIYLDGLLAFKRANFVAARDLSLQILKNFPDNLPSLTLAGISTCALHAHVQCQEYLRKVLERNPQALHIRKLLIDSYLQTGNTAAAAHLLDEVGKDVPADAGLRILAAEVAVASGDLDAAARFYKQAENDAASPYPTAAIRLGEIEFSRGNAQGAVRILETASVNDKKGSQSDAMLAVYYAAQGQPDKALRWVESVEKKDQHSPVPSTLRGSIYLRTKAYPAAREQFGRALALQANFIPALEGLARVDVAENKPEAAKKRFEEQLSKDPGNEVLALRYTRFLRGVGAPLTEVVNVLQGAAKKQPSSLNTRLALISVYLELGDAAQAKAVSQEALALAPDSREALVLAGRAQLAAGERNEAVATFEKLVSLPPKAIGPLLLLAEAHLANRDRQRAISALRRALALQDDLVDIQVRLLQLYLADGNTRDALATAREIQQQRPNEPVGYRAEADVLTKMRDYAETERVLQKGFRASSSWVLVPPLHKTLLKLGRTGDADALVKRWMEANPKDVNVRTYLAQRAMQGKNYEAAARLFKEIIALEPNSGAALNNLAWIAGETHDPRALEYAEQANQLLPNVPPVMDTLGWLLIENGKASRGVELLQQAVELAPQLYGIRFHLAKGLIQTNQKDAARKELEYLESHIDDVEAKAEVEALLRQL
jgi:putative PEP-CTERM system TPR-repeat lipoprotein